MVMLFIEFAIIMLLAEAGLVFVGLGALLLAYLGVLIVAGPPKGRGLSTAFVHAIPPVVVISIVAGASVIFAELSDVRFSAPCHLTGDYALMMADADSPGWVYRYVPGKVSRGSRTGLTASCARRSPGNTSLAAETRGGSNGTPL
jgi:hypothetical protein